MTTPTSQISATLATAAETTAESRTDAERHLASIRENAEFTHAHGWHGIGSTLDRAGEHLEAALEYLDTTHQSCEVATEALDRASAQTGVDGVLEHLLAAAEHIRTAQQAAGTVIESIDEAIEACLATDDRRTSASLSVLREEIDGINDRLLNAETETNAEHEQVESWSQQSPRTADVRGGNSQPQTALVGTTDPTMPGWAERAGRLLPVRAPKDKTHGFVFDHQGRQLRTQSIESGNDATLIADLSLSPMERRSVSLLSHVEAKTAAQMRHGELPRDTVLVLNNRPCAGPLGCDTYLPSILPAGSSLAVFVTEGSTTYPYRTFHGTGSKIRP